MDAKTTIALLYRDGTTRTHHDVTVLEILKKFQTDLTANEPLAILRPDLGINLYFDKYRLGMYKLGIQGFDTVLEYLQCQGLYRNKVMLRASGDDEVDPESLWRLWDNTLYLVDDDRHITTDFNASGTSFYQIT